jgi:hypothetical protein
MIRKRNQTKRKRTTDATRRGMQDAVAYGFPVCPYRPGTPEHKNYARGFAQALHSLPPAYVSPRRPQDIKTTQLPTVWAGPQPNKEPHL